MASVVFPPKVHNLNSSHKEASDELKVSNILQNHWPVPWKAISVMKDKERQLNVTRDLGSWIFLCHEGHY